MKITSLLKSIIVVLALSITTLTHAQEATNQIPEVSTMEELFNALGDKESIQVLFKNLEPKFVTKNLYIDAYMPDEKTLINSSKVIPSKADVIGTYKFVEDYNGYRFVFDSIINIHSFHCLNYTKEYYNQTKESIALETITAITPMIVTAIDGNNVFVQYKNLDKTPCNDMLSINGKHSLTLGDKIENIPAKYIPTKIEINGTDTAILRNDYFIVESTNIGTTTPNNRIQYAPISSLDILNTSFFIAKAVQLPIGGTIEKKENTYNYTLNSQSIELKSNTINLEEYIGQTLEQPIFGVLDNKHTANNTFAVIVNKIEELNTNYETIAEWIEAAQSGITTGSLKNPVNVTLSIYQSYKSFVFIEDKTAAICLNFGDLKENPIKTGHVISGIKGTLKVVDDKTNLTIAPQITMTSDDTTNIQILDSITVYPMNITIAELNADEKAIANGEAPKYANRLVQINGVKKGSKWIGNNPRVYPLIQGEDTLAYSTSTLKDFSSKLETLQMTIIGVIDYQTINASKLYSIYPRSIDDVHLVAPEFTPIEDVYEKEVKVTLSMFGEKGVDYTNVYYTIDGSDPFYGTEYTEPITITENTTILAIATYLNDESKTSPAVEATYTIVDKIDVPQPTFTPDATEEYTDQVDVTINNTATNAVILYDLEGQAPTSTSRIYNNQPLRLTQTTTIAAVAALIDKKGNIRTKENNDLLYTSDVITVTYIVKPTIINPGVATDEVELMAIVYSYAGNIHINAEIGSTIEVYTINGQNIFADKATSNITTIEAGNNNILLVRVNGETVKVAIK